MTITVANRPRSRGDDQRGQVNNVWRAELQLLGRVDNLSASGILKLMVAEPSRKALPL